MMPVAMLIGLLFYPYMTRLAFLTPYFIFIMLFFTFIKIRWRHIRLTKLHAWLILIQVAGSMLVYALLLPVDKILAQGLMVCVIAPTATAAPVITGMLKGNVESLTAYSLLSNIAIVIFAPFIFSLVGKTGDVSYVANALSISKSVVLFVFSPLVLAFLTKMFLPKINQKLAAISGISFWLWSAALAIVTGKTIAFILQQNSGYATEVALAGGALVVCILLFVSGKLLGRQYGDTIAGGQGLGQKNTILAIWMSQTYLHPLSSVAPGMYVIWQNLFNSWQIWHARKTL